MGNTLTAPSLTSTQQDLPTLLLDVPAYIHHSVLGGGKIFRTLQALHEDGTVVIKLYVRRSTDFDLKRYEAKLDDLCAKLPLSQCPSILNLVKLEITDRAVYLGRQYLGQNLVERFHVHPNLTPIEKAWLTYQMLHAVHQIHSRGVRHGDIKTENFLLTSWNWLFLVDIAFYKPTFLPNDNPADYHFYFENQGIVGSNGMITQSARRRCYLAPERFYSVITDRKFQEPSANGGSGGSDGQVSEAMDIFSLGCVIAELFLDGEQVLFDLPSLLAYREGEYDPSSLIAKVPDPQVRRLIKHMIQREPSRRLSAKQYMKLWSTPGGLDGPELNPPQGVTSPSHAQAAQPTPLSPTTIPSTAPPLFPSYFAYLYRFFAKLLTPELADPDIKVQTLKTHRDAIVREVLGREDRGEGTLTTSRANTVGMTEQAPVPVSKRSSGSTSAQISAKKGPELLAAVTDLAANVAQRTQGLATLEELQEQARLRGGGSSAAATTTAATTPPRSMLLKPGSSPFLSPSPAPSAAALLDIASASNPSSTPSLQGRDGTTAQQDLDGLTLDNDNGNGLTMICSIVCSCLQNVRYPITKLTALELLADFGAYVDDEVRLGRLVPYAVALLADPSAMVKSTSCHILTKLLSQVQSIHSASDAHLFLEYILPSLSRFPNDPEEIVKLSYAQCIAELAASSKRFLDMAQYARQVAARQGSEGGASSSGAPSTALATANSNIPPAIVPFDATYTADLGILQDTVLKLVIDMLTLGGSKVKRALLADITKLCIFMERKRVNNDLLPHLITVLNDRDWQLRSAFFEYIVGVSLFVGRVAFQNFVLPCIEQALFDVAEFVIERAVHALTALINLFEKRTMLEVAAKVGPLLCHPSAWIRAETVKFIATMSASLGPAKSLVFLQPILRPFLIKDLPDMSVETLTQHLKPHLTREEFRKAVAPAAQTKAVEEPAPITTSTAKGTQSKPVSINASSNQPVAAANNNAFVAESYAGPSRLFEVSGGASWVDTSGPLRTGAGGGTTGTQNKTVRPALVAEEPSASQLAGLDDSLDSVSGSASSGFKDDPMLAQVMSMYLARVSSAIQAKSLQSPSSNSAVFDARVSSMDEDSMLIEMQNLSLSQTLEEQLPLHQLDIEPTVPELGSLTGGLDQRQLDRAAQETFDSLGIGPTDRRVAGAARPIDPSLIPAARSTPGAAPAGLTAGPTTQGGHPVALRENLAGVPAYIKAALGVPLPPPNLGALRADWTTHSRFYGNHRVLSTSPEAVLAAEMHDPKLWRPKGVLVATLSEHRHVRSLAVARDNLFLASGGDEGVVKIWDSQRLKLTAHARSQLSYVQHGRIMSLAVCDSSHAVASASSNGSLHVFKVEHAASTDEAGTTTANKYVGLSDVKRVDPDPVHGEGAILKVAHFNTLTESLLMYGTQKAVHGWDLRSKKDSLDLRLEPSMGLLTSMDVGPSPYVLVTGTSRGFITVWDLRFQLPVQVWRHSAKTAITQITSVDSPSILPKEVQHGASVIHANASALQYPHPTKGPLFFCAAEGTNQLAGFDVYTGESRMLLRVLNPTSSASSSTGGATSSTGPQRKGSFTGGGPAGAQAPAGGASYPNRTRQKVRVSPLSLPSLRSYIRSEYSGSSSTSGQSGDVASYPAYSSSSGFYQSLMGVTLDDGFLREFATMGHPDHAASATGSSINSTLVCKDSFVLTAGTDKKVRFWDLGDPANSYRVSSEDLSEGDYLRYNSRLENTTVVLEEVLSNQATTAGIDGRISEAEMLRIKLAAVKKHAGQQAPPTAHSSEIVDMKAFEHPQKMLATASRDGLIKIWI